MTENMSKEDMVKEAVEEAKAKAAKMVVINVPAVEKIATTIVFFIYFKKSNESNT